MTQDKNEFTVVETSVETSVKTPIKTPIETRVKDGKLKYVGQRKGGHWEVVK